MVEQSIIFGIGIVFGVILCRVIFWTFPTPPISLTFNITQASGENSSVNSPSHSEHYDGEFVGDTRDDGEDDDDGEEWKKGSDQDDEDPFGDDWRKTGNN